ncbi:GxxExxY protein [Chryseobacterium koreense]|uniref:GxxExxY protein n=1 Tax=Chryseobacterium koreense TaxID=232216 RepID=UPI00161C6321|nr:GxxExxY protein [Chryseobacterium koreense]MBB5334619.1 GxxExxY protein [Chryseobacterium koreense]
MTENDLTYAIRKAIFAVYNTLGSGLLESVYERALVIELESQGLKTESQYPISFGIVSKF